MQDRWIVQLTPGAALDAGSVGGVARLLQGNSINAQVIEGLGMEGLVLVATQPGTSVAAVENYFARNPAVFSFDPDAIVENYSDSILPNDTDFGKQWSLKNDGQSFGTVDADIDAPEAWSAVQAWDIVHQNSPDVVVAVIDSGVDYTHPDLAPNMWTNPGEIPGNGIDDDGDGFIDDVHGYNFWNGTGSVWDDSGHGTHVAGIVAAAGNDHNGVIGVGWQHTKIMAVKNQSALGELYHGSDGSDTLKSINYVVVMKQQFGVNVRVINASWGIDYSFCNVAVSSAQDAGILFVAAAGNKANDNDQTPDYPSCLTQDNVISVASSDINDNLSPTSNYGATSVDLAAPGVNIYSTTPRTMFNTNLTPNYSYDSGTSMAAPQVAATAALLWSMYPTATYQEVRQAIFAGVDHIPSLNGKMVTGGRLNVLSAINHMKMGVDVNDSAYPITPTVGSTIYSTPPYYYTIPFTYECDPATTYIRGDAFTINGQSANSAQLSPDHKSITFHFNDVSFMTHGPLTMAILANKIKRASSSDYAVPWQGTFYYSTSPVTISSNASPPGAPQYIILTFNQDIEQNSIGIDDLSLSAGSVIDAHADSARVVRYTVTGLPRRGNVTYVLKAGGLSTTAGVPVAGVAATPYTGHFTIDDSAVQKFTSQPGTPYTITIPTPDSTHITDLDVEIDADIGAGTIFTADLHAPPATGIVAYDFVYDWSVGKFTIDDEANTPSDDYHTGLTDRFKPRQYLYGGFVYTPPSPLPLSAFDGINSAGDWTLSITYTGGSFALNSWSLIINGEIAPHVDAVNLNAGSLYADDVTGAQPLPLGDQANPGKTWAAINTLGVQFSEEMNPTIVTATSNWELKPVGGNAVSISVSYAPNTDRTAYINTGILPAGTYELTIRGSIINTAAVGLDGDGDGTPGGDYVRYFTVHQRGGVTFSDGFENGLASCWEMNPGSGTAGISTTNGHNSAHSLVLGTSTYWAGTQSATLHLDLYGQSNVVLDFWQKNYGAVYDASMDRVEVSDDGNRWYIVESLTGTSSAVDYQHHIINLDAAVVAANKFFNRSSISSADFFTYSHDFQIRFSQDNSSCNSGGLAFDDINVSTNDLVGPTATLSVPAAPYSSAGYPTYLLDYVSGFDNVVITFNESVQNLGLDDVFLYQPQGGVIHPNGMSVDGTTFTFPNQTQRGTYRLVVAGDVADVAGDAGNAINQNGVPIVLNGNGDIVCPSQDVRQFCGTITFDPSQVTLTQSPGQTNLYIQDFATEPGPEWDFEAPFATVNNATVSVNNGCLEFDAKAANRCTEAILEVSSWESLQNFNLEFMAKADALDSGTLSICLCQLYEETHMDLAGYPPKWQQIVTYSPSTDFSHYTLDLASLAYSVGIAGGPLYIGFFDLSASASRKLYLDDVLLSSRQIGSGIVNCHVFYNDSRFDAHGGYPYMDPGPSVYDNVAIATDKQALLPGEVASFANFTSYSKGINGIMIDIRGLPAGDTLSSDDFVFKAGNDYNPAGWLRAPNPSITVTRGGGTDGSDRVTLIWPDGTIVNEWLQVTIKATLNTGLAEQGVFYFGNLEGESGNDTTVDVQDEDAALNHRTGFTLATVTNNYDYNRDRQVNAADALIARHNSLFVLNAPRTVSSCYKAFCIPVCNIDLNTIANQTVNEGKLLDLSSLAYFIDPDYTDLPASDNFVYQIDWGDSHADTGLPTIYASENPGNPIWGTIGGSHRYSDDGTYTVTVTVLDENGAQTSESFEILVNNIAPYLSISGDQSVSANSPYTLYLSSSDPGADTIDHWTVNWGDGNTQTVNGNPSSVQHYYSVASNYTISATATDEDGTYSTGGTAGGVLDSTFGNGGIVTTSVSIAANPDNVNQYARSMVIQPDGKIIVVGDGDPGCYYIARYNADGSLDTDFGIDGEIITNNPSKAVALQSDGKILVAGTWTNGGAVSGDFSIVRYNPDGTLDLSFGSGGKVLTDIASNSVDTVSAITVQADGKILLSGASSGSGSLVRYNADGSLDTGFASQGKLVTSTCASIYFLSVQSSGAIVACGGTHLLHYAADGTLQSDSTLTIDFVVDAVSIQSDGKIVTAGYKLVNGSPNCFALARYNTDGSLDTTFDGDGEVTTSFAGVTLANSLVIQSDGKIIAAGMANGYFALARYNTDGSLDTGFDGDGKLTLWVAPYSSNAANALAIQSDGKIVAAGYAGPSSADFALARFNTDGSLDNSFDSDGKVVTSFGSNDSAFSSAIQSDGKIVVAGCTGSSDFALIRYNADGSLDTTFNGTGIVTTDFGGDDRIYSIKIQSDGKIVVAGTSGGNFALARYNTDGSLDTTFDTDGKLTTDFGGSDVAYALAIQSDGKIVAAGTNGSDFALARYNTDGSLDSTFDTDGKLTTDLGGTDAANAIAIQSDGKIVVAGKNTVDFAVARYNADGSLDTSFDADGKLTTNVYGYDTAYAISIQSDGKIVVAGSSGTAFSAYRFSLVRYNADGSLDTSFDTDGKVTTTFSGYAYAYAMAIQSDGKIVVAGSIANGSSPTISDFALARYNADGSLDTTFDADGTLTTNLGGMDYGRSVILQPDGRIVVAGYAMNDFAVARFYPGTINVTVTVS
jgi:uncharacterized delta-60 repeat protein